MPTTLTALFAGLLGIAFGLAGGFVPSEADALVFCAKTRNPSKIKIRGDVCKANETEMSVLDVPEVQAELDALANDVDALMDQSHIYVNTRLRPVSGGSALIGTSIMCDEGDVATGGGVTSNSAGSSGPYLHYSGPVLDEFDTPIGWKIGVGEVSNDIEFHVICAQVNSAPPVSGRGPGSGPPILPGAPSDSIIGREAAPR